MRYGSVILLLIFALVIPLQAQTFNGTDAIPLGGEYNVQQVTSQCDDRFNGITTSRFFAERFERGDDGHMRIGNENRSLLYRGTDEVGVFTNNIDGGTQRTMTIVSDTLFIIDSVWSAASPCNTQMIYTYARPTPPDLDQVDGIPLPRSTSESSLRFNVNSLRENCPILGDRLSTRDNSQINFKLQADGRILVANYGNDEGYSNGRYYLQTSDPHVYMTENDYSQSYIYLYTPEYFQRETYFRDGCVLSDTYFLSGEVIFEGEGSAFDDPLSGVSDTSTSDTPASTTEPAVALVNGVTVDPPEGWEIRYTGNNNEIIMGYADEASDSRLELRLFAGQGLVFGMNTNYDPNTHSIDEIFTFYFQAVPPNYSTAGLVTSDVTIAGLSGIRGEVSNDEVIRSLTILETDNAGRVGVMIFAPKNTPEALQMAVDDLLATLNTENAIDSPADFMIELSNGDVLNPETAEVSFGDFPQFNMMFAANGTIGETTTITLFPDYPIPAGTLNLQTMTMTQMAGSVGVSIPLTINDELYTVVYASNINGTLTVETDGVSIDGELNFTADFSRLNKGFEFNLEIPDGAPPIPDTITVTGNFSNIVPPPAEQE